MRRSTLGKILFIIGIYLMFIFPILSLTLNKGGDISFGVQLDPLSYWVTWLMMYGFFTILLTELGVFLIILGYRYIKD